MDMKKVKIGMRVRYCGNSVIGPCSGVVEKLYPPLPEDLRDPESIYPGAVRMRPDELPEKWPYSGETCFAPWVNELEPEKTTE